MENADALDLSKENIQPLKKGRNPAQLGLALQAQTDTTLHQMLSKKQEWYEMQIRAYEGEDKLGLWCDYISWVEQSFPKHGPEGNLSSLLTKCFQVFKDEEKYRNDVRFVKLWIKYIEMQNDVKRVELYKLLNTQGIGLRCAEFYRSWAYEYECLNDWKQAEQIFKRGLSNMAEPAEELNAAHERFLASYAFAHSHMNNESHEELLENHLQADHRLPMAALKPVGKKSSAPNVRVGANVRSQLPGVVPATQGTSGRSAPSSRTFGVRGNNTAPVAIYQQRGETESEGMHAPQNIPLAVPMPQSLNKENRINPGPWTGQGLGSRRLQSASVHSFAPRQPGFEVHRDEESENASNHDVRSHGMLLANALKPCKALEDGFQDAIAIFEEPANPNMKAMYRKKEVYCGGKELQLEELHAISYFRKKAEEQKAKEMSYQQQTDQNQYFPKRQWPHSSPSSNSQRIMQDHYMSARESDEHPGNRQSFQESLLKQSLLSGNSAVHVGPSPGISNAEFPAINPVTHVDSALRSLASTQPATSFVTPMVSAVGPHYRNNLQQHQPPQLSLKPQPLNQSMHNQSMTVHTKLAIDEVNNLWGSPTVVKSSANLIHPPSTSKCQPAFHIRRDDTLVIENSPVRQVEQSSFIHNDFQESLALPRVDETMPVPDPYMFSFDDPSMNISAHISKANQLDSDGKMEVCPIVTSHNFVSIAEPQIFVSPPTVSTFNQGMNGGQFYPKDSYTHAEVPAQKGKFQVFCDDDRGGNNVPTRTISFEKEDLSSSAHTSSSSVQKVAKEKENIHKFPLADMELMEDCVATPVEVPSETRPSQQANHYEVPTPSYVLPVQSQPSLYKQECSSVTLQPTHSIQHQAIPMEDDVTVAAAPQFGINMSETGNTEAFFFPKVDASSTPFRDSSRKPRASRSPIDFNSSLYRVEQTRPFDPEENGGNGSGGASDSPKTVPPLKLFRIKHDDNQLSAILESSKEKHQSVLSSGSSRSSISSALVSGRYGMYTTQRQSLGPQPSLNLIHESSEPVSSQEGQTAENQSMSDLSTRLSKGNINPFDSRLLEQFLAHIGFPLPHHVDGYCTLNAAVPAKRNNNLNLNGEVFNIVKSLGEGAYAKVLKGIHVRTQREVALKIQKPSCRWEYYICREIQQRLSQRHLASAFMPADQIFVYNNGSVIVTDLLPFGTLLNLANKVKASTKRNMQELQSVFLIQQIMGALAALHECKIIHGDLKPDNILMRAIPALHQEPCIQLIDFGRSIDMSLMPTGTTFKQMVLTESFTCIEMRTGKPWTYQTDLYGLANTAHCLLLGTYMDVQESRSTGRWAITARLARNSNAEFWGTFFDTLLNIESCDVMPDLEILRSDAQAYLNSQSNAAALQISALGRLLLER